MDPSAAVFVPAGRAGACDILESSVQPDEEPTDEAIAAAVAKEIESRKEEFEEELVDDESEGTADPWLPSLTGNPAPETILAALYHDPRENSLLVPSFVQLPRQSVLSL